MNTTNCDNILYKSIPADIGSPCKKNVHNETRVVTVLNCHLPPSRFFPHSSVTVFCINYLIFISQKGQFLWFIFSWQNSLIEIVIGILDIALKQIWMTIWINWFGCITPFLKTGYFKAEKVHQHRNLPELMLFQDFLPI